MRSTMASVNLYKTQSGVIGGIEVWLSYTKWYSTLGKQLSLSVCIVNTPCSSIEPISYSSNQSSNRALSRVLEESVIAYIIE